MRKSEVYKRFILYSTEIGRAVQQECRDRGIPAEPLFRSQLMDVDLASEFRYRNPILQEHDLVIIISQSGETADSLAALREAKNRGVQTLGIVNVVGSSIAREADRVTTPP